MHNEGGNQIMLIPQELQLNRNLLCTIEWPVDCKAAGTVRDNAEEAS